MSGIFGVVSDEDCLSSLYYGTDYHSHLGTSNAGLAVTDGDGIHKKIHDISRKSFRPQFAEFARNMRGDKGIGVISDYEPQPLIIEGNQGSFGIVHAGKIGNLERLAEESKSRGVHFSEMSGNEVNPVELIGSLVSRGRNIVDGLQIMQEEIEGSSSTFLLTEEGIYLSRDKKGRTPVVVGSRSDSMAAAMETTSFPNLGYKTTKNLGPGEIGILTSSGYEQLKEPEEEESICSFLWIYYGYPSSSFLGLNVEEVRNKCGACLGRRDDEEGIDVDIAAGVPDSGTGHGLGYASERGIPFKRPYVKYSPTWDRSFMPVDIDRRDENADMKLIPISEIIENQRIAVSDDSIVRARQLAGRSQELYECGAREVHGRPGCPPIMFPCKFLNFSITEDVYELGARRAVRKLERGQGGHNLGLYLDEDSKNHGNMIGVLEEELGLTSLKYQRLGDMVEAIGLPKERLCTYCWDRER